jgi:hypothetical protein
MRAMRVVLSDSAAELIRASGGRLYVWPKRAGCCGSLTTLVTSSVAPKRKEFRRVAVDDRFELFLPSRLGRLPEEIHLDTSRFSRQVRAYWNGCAWVA